MDATESVVVSGPLGRQLRLFWRPGMTARDELQAFSRELAERFEGIDSPAAWAAWCHQIATLNSRENVDERVWLIGQDGAFAAALARKGRTVGAVLAHMRERTRKNLAGAAAARALGPEGPLARSHGTRFPIVQGPMTRVSDVAPFSLAVAEAGAPAAGGAGARCAGSKSGSCWSTIESSSAIDPGAPASWDSWITRSGRIRCA